MAELSNFIGGKIKPVKQKINANVTDIVRGTIATVLDVSNNNGLLVHKIIAGKNYSGGVTSSGAVNIYADEVLISARSWAATINSNSIIFSNVFTCKRIRVEGYNDNNLGINVTLDAIGY